MTPPSSLDAPASSVALAEPMGSLRHAADLASGDAARTLDASPLLEMRGICKSFPGVQALQNVELNLHRGEVLALLGENGAGKSTLMKILGGAYRPDAGSIWLGGQQAQIASPTDAARAGVAVIYQEFNLIPALTVRENIFLGRESHRLGFGRRGEEVRRTRELFARLDIEIDPEARCDSLKVAQQQIVEIARALFVNARVIVMDEPTAALTSRDAERLFAVIRELKAQGLGLIYISHRLEEIEAIADRVTVLRDGKYVGTRPIGELNRESMIEMMVGRKLEDEFPHRVTRPAEERLRVRGLSGGKVRDVSFAIRRGEVLGLTGLVGAGRTEVARMIFGADRAEAGTIELDGQPLRMRSPRDAIEHGICLLSEDRKQQGLVLGLSVRENFALPNLRRLSRLNFINRRSEAAAYRHFSTAMRIKSQDPREAVRNLSGGNQQRVVLAKWLQRNCEVLIFDEPTRGIDVGAKYEIYLLMNELAAQGKAILLISSELPEVLGMSDRILVMHEGRLKGELTNGPQVTQEAILRMAVS